MILYNPWDNLALTYMQKVTRFKHRSKLGNKHGSCGTKVTNMTPGSTLTKKYYKYNIWSQMLKNCGTHSKPST